MDQDFDNIFLVAVYEEKQIKYIIYNIKRNHRYRIISKITRKKYNQDP
jgi:hypothetical protein